MVDELKIAGLSGQTDDEMLRLDAERNLEQAVKLEAAVERITARLAIQEEPPMAEDAINILTEKAEQHRAEAERRRNLANAILSKLTKRRR